MDRRSALAAVLLSCVLLSGSDCGAGLRLPGKYSGVVVFDRWDGCYLCSGVYLMYVSEKVKDQLRQYKGQCVEVNATRVYQPVNPGDARIEEFVYCGPAKDGQDSVQVEGLVLSSCIRLARDGKAIGQVRIENNSQHSIKLVDSELGFTVMMSQRGDDWEFPSDGLSVALITRQSFQLLSGLGWRQREKTGDGREYSWTVEAGSQLPHDFDIAPEQRQEISIRFDLPQGAYEFFCGYGGGVNEGKCVLSNLAAFDVDAKGNASVVKIKGRPVVQF